MDSINHPKHYTQGPKCSKCENIIECIDITEDKDFCIGNAIKYLWRYELKEKPIEDLKKALWYINRKIQKLEKKENEKS